MAAPRQERELTFPEVELSVDFYDRARDYLSETFEQITKRVLGSKTFANFPHPKAFEHECKTMFELAHAK